MRSPVPTRLVAARQYSGTVGGIALCRVAVTVTYATGRGHALIVRAFYLPGARAADEEHRELAGVPEEVMFATSRSWPTLCWNARKLRESALPSWQATRHPMRLSCQAAWESFFGVSGNAVASS
jgi:hypothetical protein